MTDIGGYTAGIPAFLGYFVGGVGVVCLFLGGYLALTPQRELSLIRGGSVAAATSLAGALLGACLPVASALAQSVTATDLAIWSAIAIGAQTAAYGLVRLLLPGFPGRIESGELAAGLLSATIHLSVGLINAAAMVG